MTQTDLRIQFKMETGEYPVWPQGKKRKIRNGYIWIRSGPEAETFRGKRKSVYGLWLEEKLGGFKKLREEYFIEYKINPVYLNSRYSNAEYLTAEYMEWLEEKSLAIYK